MGLNMVFLAILTVYRAVRSEAAIGCSGMGKAMGRQQLDREMLVISMTFEVEQRLPGEIEGGAASLEVSSRSVAPAGAAPIFQVGPPHHRVSGKRRSQTARRRGRSRDDSADRAGEVIAP